MENELKKDNTTIIVKRKKEYGRVVKENAGVSSAGKGVRGECLFSRLSFAV